MKRQFVQTSNSDRFRDAYKMLLGRGARESCFLLVTGEAGFGKSASVRAWATQPDVNAVFMRAKVDWTPHYFESEIANWLKVDQKGRGGAREFFGRLVAKLLHERSPIVIDEVEHCLRDNAAVLEHVRDITDITETPVVLVGMDQVQPRIARHPQLSTRIADIVTFGAATEDDVGACCRALSEAEIAPDLVAEISRQARGRMREVLNAIALCEREAKKNKLPRIGLADMGNRPLTLNWQDRRPRAVR